MDLVKLENFLIKESNVNKEFIKDFFGIQKTTLYNKYKPFTMNLDDIAYWLDTEKGLLIRTLNNSYTKNIDYIVMEVLLGASTKQKHNNNTDENRGGHNHKTVLLTPDCFKMICMRSRTVKAEKVRKYYVDLEKLIDKYKDTIINTQDKKIKILENDLSKDKYDDGNHCYIFEETDELNEIYYRIGQSKNMKKRMANHNASNVHKKVIIFDIITDNLLHYENCLRGVMFNYRYKHNKDYYKISYEKLKYSVENCTTITKYLKKPKNNQIGGYIDEKEIDKNITKLFSNIGNDVRWNFYREPRYAYYKGKYINSQIFNKIILEQSDIPKTLVVPVHRSGEYMENINLGTSSLTYKKLFNILYKFYNKDIIKLDQLLKIPKDMDNYVNNTINKSKSGKLVHRIMLVGNLNRYEGIHKLDNNLFVLEVGS